MGLGLLIDTFLLGLVSLGISVAAMLLAIYELVRGHKASSMTGASSTGSPGPIVPKSPLQAPEPFGVRLKRRLDKG